MGSSVNAAEPYMPPFKDNMFLFVHGVNSDQYTWFSPDKNGKPREDGDTNKWWNYIHQSLGVSNYHMAQYSFSSGSGSHEVNMLELGNGMYASEGGLATAENNRGEIEVGGGKKIKKSTGISGDNSWLEQARVEYKQALFGDKRINPEDRSNRLWEKIEDIPDALLPSKLVMLGHSQANYAIRGYIQSGALARERGFFQDGESVPDYLLSKVGKRKIQENPLGFYDWPVEKVVFINPPLKGSDMAWVLVYRVVQVLQRIMDPKAFGIGNTTGGVGDLAMLTALMADPNDLHEALRKSGMFWLMEPSPFANMEGPPGLSLPKTNGALIIEIDERLSQLKGFGIGNLNMGLPKVSFGEMGFGDPSTWLPLLASGKKGDKGLVDFLSALFCKKAYIEIGGNGEYKVSASRGNCDGIIEVAIDFEGLNREAEKYGQQNIPGQSVIMGIGDMAKWTGKQIPFLRGMMDTAFVNAGAKSISAKWHLGSGGTSEAFTALSPLSESIGKLSDPDMRRWQPKYRVLSAEGSIAVNLEATRLAMGIEVTNKLQKRFGGDVWKGGAWDSFGVGLASSNETLGIEPVGTADFQQTMVNVRNLNRLEVAATLKAWPEGRYNVTAKATILPVVLPVVKTSIENLTLRCV